MSSGKAFQVTLDGDRVPENFVLGVGHKLIVCYNASEDVTKMKITFDGIVPYKLSHLL